jgi:uncharacterized RDD family membrane protein YckC
MPSFNRDNLYADSFKRSVASMFDIIIVLILRCITLEILGRIWVDKIIIKFMADFKAEFGTEEVTNTPAHVNFILHHQFFSTMLELYFIIIMVGALYHAILNSSKWQATIGKKIMKIVIIDNSDYGEISFFKALAHYFLSVLPMVYVIYLIAFQAIYKLSFYQTIIATKYNVFFGIIFTAWLQAHLFTKNRSTAYDMILNTSMINGVTKFRFPFSKKPRMMTSHG